MKYSTDTKPPKPITVKQCRDRFGDSATELILADVAQRSSPVFRIGLKMYELTD